MVEGAKGCIEDSCLKCQAHFLAITEVKNVVTVNIGGVSKLLVNIRTLSNSCQDITHR